MKRERRARIRWENVTKKMTCAFNYTDRRVEQTYIRK